MAIKSKAAQEFVPIQEIRDGIVILKDGTMRLVLMASSINLALKSIDEQMAIILQFQNFLNTLEFSTQIFIQSRRLDIRPYLSILENRLQVETNDLLKIQIHEYIGFIKTVTHSTNIMNKIFLVVVPYAPPVSVVTQNSKPGILDSLLGKKEQPKQKLTKNEMEAFEEAKSQLEQRASIIKQGLARTNVRVIQLETEELTELYYRLFNPGENEGQVTAK